MTRQKILTLLPVLIFSIHTATATEIAVPANAKVGFAAIDLEPKIGIPLAGYGHKDRRLPSFIDWFDRFPDAYFFRPSDGQLDTLRAKTLYIESQGKHLIFVSVDTIGVEFRLIDDLLYDLAFLGIKREELFVSGTHTHSGPGTLSRRIPLEVIAVDLFVRENYEHIRMKILQSILTAQANATEANLYKTSFKTSGIQINKWRKDLESYDSTARLLIARDAKTGFNLGTLIQYAVHGGSLGPDNHKYSADLPGAIEREMEAELSMRNVFMGPKPVAVFMNGPEGDVGPRESGYEKMLSLAQTFRKQSRSALEQLQKVEPTLSMVSKKIYLGIPKFPQSIRRPTAEHPHWCKISFPMVGLMALRARIGIARLGDITFLSWPGEASTSLGYQLQDTARKAGASDPWILGLTNDYMAYFTNEAEFKEGTYDSQSSLFNYRGGQRIIRAHQKLLTR